MLQKPNRTKDKTLLKEISKKPCLICGQTPSDPDHIITRGAGGGDTITNLWPLCRNHHIERHKIGLDTFSEKYGLTEILEKRGIR